MDARQVWASHDDHQPSQAGQVLREQAKGHFWEEAEGQEFGVTVDGMDAELSDGEYIYIEEGDLD